MNLTHFKSEFASMRRTLFRASLLGLGLIVGLGACKDDDDNTGVPAGGKAYIRYVNGMWQQFVDSTSPSTMTFFFRPVSIDVLIDSSGTKPGVTGLAPNSVSTGDEGLLAESGFFLLEPGVHSFVARRGDKPNAPSFFVGSTGSSCAPAQYLPRQQMTGTTFYTMIIAGANPRQTRNSAGDSIHNLAALVIPGSGSSACSFTAVVTPNSLSSVEDPFSPPWNTYGGSDHYQARFFIWNAAPFANSKNPLSTVSSERASAIRMYLSPDAATPPDATDINGLQYWDSANFQSKGSAQNVAAGTYWMTFVAYRSTSNMPIIWQEKVTFEEGEVSTFFMLNKLPPGKQDIRWTDPANTYPDGATSYSDYFQVVRKKMNEFSF